MQEFLKLVGKLESNEQLNVTKLGEWTPPFWIFAAVTQNSKIDTKA